MYCMFLRAFGQNPPHPLIAGANHFSFNDMSASQRRHLQSVPEPDLLRTLPKETLPPQPPRNKEPNSTGGRKASRSSLPDTIHELMSVQRSAASEMTSAVAMHRHRRASALAVGRGSGRPSSIEGPSGTAGTASLTSEAAIISASGECMTSG